MCSWNETPSPNSLPSAVWLALFPMDDFLLIPPGGKKVHIPRLQLVSHLGSCTFSSCMLPRNGSPVPTNLSAELNTTTV